MSFFKIHGGNLGADKVGFDFAIIVLCWFFHQPDEEDAAKMKWKGSLKIRRGKLKKLSLDGSPDERQQS